MAASFRIKGKFKPKRSSYKRGNKTNQEWCHDLQEFTFDYDENSDEEISFTETTQSSQLRKRDAQNGTKDFKQKSDFKKQHIIYEIQASDTLQSISLRFGCQVAELKLANKLMTDQDFYAHRTIQIPVSEHGVLSEDFSQIKKDIQPSHDTDNIISVSIGEMFADTTSATSRSFLQAMDNDIQHIVETTRSQVNEESEVLNSPRFHTMATPQNTSCDGSNWGINRWNLLIVFIVIMVVIPVSYGLYRAS